MVLFKPHPKQQEFIDACFSGDYRFLFYGGAAGGGKSYVGIAILILLAKFFPNSRWCVVRKDAGKLRQNTLNTFYKICPRRFLLKYSNGTAYFTNGSQIIFKGENYIYDKDLTWMDGFEVNGFLFEEVQELNKKLFEKAKLRAGRHIIEPMPPILTIMTGNPSQNWSKTVFVEPWQKGELAKPFLFMPAKMEDNPSLDEGYIEGLKSLDSNTYQRYVLGNWDVIDVEKPFAYAFRSNGPNSHIGDLKKPLPSMPINLSFDFNVDPITCTVWQHNGKHNKDGWIRCHKEYKLKDSNIYALCKAIREDHKGYYMYVTGDASGHNRSGMVADSLTYYKIIQAELNLSNTQLRVEKTSNPQIVHNRVLVNSLLEKFPSIIFDRK